jgi:type 1 glutamine amidotransferase
LAWAWRPRGGRVFSSLLGYRDDFRQPDFLHLLANAVRWAAAVAPA